MTYTAPTGLLASGDFAGARAAAGVIVGAGTGNASVRAIALVPRP